MIFLINNESYQRIESFFIRYYYILKTNLKKNIILVKKLNKIIKRNFSGSGFLSCRLMVQCEENLLGGQHELSRLVYDQSVDEGLS